MELIYYYAKGHNNLPSQGLNFSNKWKATYDQENGDITIEKNSNCIDNFYGKNITSVCAMVGANGTGKTTILNTISRTIAHGNNIGPSGAFSFLTIYEKEGSFFLYPFNKIKYKKNKIFTLVSDLKWKSDLQEIISIFFSQHIEPLYSSNVFHEREEKAFPGRKDISTAFIYRQTILKNYVAPQNITRQF